MSSTHSNVSRSRGSVRSRESPIAENAVDVLRIGATLRTMNPRAVVTCARGSSDHAATYAKYLIETYTKTVTSSAAPSLSSIYDATPDLRGVLFIAISQSGKSPDLLAAVEHAKALRRVRARACAIRADSPLATERRCTPPFARRPRDQRRGNEIVHRLAERDLHMLASWTQERS